MFHYGEPLSPIMPEPHDINFNRCGAPAYCTHCAASNRAQLEGASSESHPLFFVIDGHAQIKPGEACRQFSYKKRAARIAQRADIEPDRIATSRLRRHAKVPDTFVAPEQDADHARRHAHAVTVHIAAAEDAPAVTPNDVGRRSMKNLFGCLVPEPDATVWTNNGRAVARVAKESFCVDGGRHGGGGECVGLAPQCVPPSKHSERERDCTMSIGG